MATLTVRVSAQIDDAPPRALTVSQVIPPTYGPADVDALTARLIEDAAFALNRREFDRAPARDALIAAAARLRAIEAIKDAMAPGPSRDQIEEIFDLTNAEATAQYGDDPEGS